MSLAEALLMEFDQEAQTTKRVLERVPDGKLAWKPHPKSFSLGQLALHIAAGPGQIVAAVAQDTAEAPDFSQPEAKSRQEVLETYAKSMASARASLKGMDDARLVSMWTLDEKWKTDDGDATDRFSALHPYESHLSPSWAAFGLSADAGCSGALDLRSQRGRKSVRIATQRSNLQIKGKETAMETTVEKSR